MSGLSAQAHYANGIKIAKCPALLLTEMLRRFVQSDFLRSDWLFPQLHFYSICTLNKLDTHPVYSFVFFLFTFTCICVILNLVFQKKEMLNQRADYASG